MEKKFCTKCRKMLRKGEFYRSNNLEKYDDSYLSLCKKCLTMHVDNWDFSTFGWILEEVDVPYVPYEWNQLLWDYAQDPSKITGTVVLGRYLAKMKLKQYTDYRWKDTEFVQKMRDTLLRNTAKAAGLEVAEIEEQIALDHELTANKPVIEVAAPPPPVPVEEPNFIPLNLPPSAPPMDNSYVFYPVEEKDEFEDELTEEDKKMLKLKWGDYRASEWVRLEQLYTQMKEDYLIDGAGHDDTLKLVCKTSLKSNQLLDAGDIDGAQKATRMYNELMKSGHFTADQNKREQEEVLNTVSELVALCELEGFIPRYYIDKPNDRVDAVIQDLKEYTHSVMIEELNLGNLIEGAIKQMAIEESRQEDDDDEEMTFEEVTELTNFDHEEFFDMVDEGLDGNDAIVEEFLRREGGE